MRILSIDGGGYLGLATAALLSVAERDLNARVASRFDLFCGTSTGAIIALAFAAGMSADDVCALYERLGPAVFPAPGLIKRRVPPVLRRLIGSAYDNKALIAALKDVFGNTTLGELRARGKNVLVTAFSLSSGRPRVFKTDHGPKLKAHDGLRVRDVALASAAAPTYLPIVELHDPSIHVTERFIDGGVVANSPALLGYAEAVSHLGACPSNIALLSLATPRTDLAERASARTVAQSDLRRGLWGWKERLAEVMLDGTAAVNGTALDLIMTAAGGRYERIELSRPAGVGLDVVSPRATETLRQLGVEQGRNADTRRRLTPFLCD